ncbi:hypothetical protein RJF_0248 [Candidozyma auris]
MTTQNGHETDVRPSEQFYPSHPSISSDTLTESKSLGDKLANCGVLNVSAYSFIRDMLNFMSDKPAKEKGAYTQILIRMNEDLNSNVSRRLAEVRFSGFNRFFEKYDLVLSEVVQASFDRVKEELSNPSKGRMTHEEQIFASFDIPNQIGDRLRIFGADPSKVTELQKSFRFVIDHTFPKLLSKGFNILYVDKLVCIVLEIHEVMSKNNSNSALSFETYIGNLAIDMTCEYTAELHDILEDLKIGPDIPRGEEMKCTIKELLSKVRSENFKLKPFHKALIDNVLNYSITCAYCICLVVCLVGCFITKDDHAPLNVTVFYAAMGSVLSCYSPFCQQVPEWENLQIKDTCKKYWKRFWSPLGSENECEDIK